METRNKFTSSVGEGKGSSVRSASQEGKTIKGKKKKSGMRVQRGQRSRVRDNNAGCKRDGKNSN